MLFLSRGSFFSVFNRENSNQIVKKENVTILDTHVCKKGDNIADNDVNEKLVQLYKRYFVPQEKNCFATEDNMSVERDQKNYYHHVKNSNAQISGKSIGLLHMEAGRVDETVGVSSCLPRDEKQIMVENDVALNGIINNVSLNSVGDVLKGNIIEEDIRENRKKDKNMKMLRYNINNYLELSKSKLTLWVTISSTFGYFMLGGSTESEFMSLIVGVFLCSSSANTFNQIMERDIDKVMNRTKRRPLVYNNRISVGHAKIFAFSTATVGSLLLYLFNNPLTSFLGMFNIFLYTCVYTPLKLKTPYNTHVGSIVGSIPTLMGCTAVEQNLLLPEPWILFFTQLLWQFPHFYSLAYLYKEDYLKGKYKMFPLLDKQNGIYTANLCKPYLFLLSSLPFFFFFSGYTSYMYILTSLLPNIFIYFKFQKILESPTKSNIRSFFKHSLWHIILLLALSTYHTQIPEKKVAEKCGNIPKEEDEHTSKEHHNQASSEHDITKFKKKLLKFCVVFS
ncbi:cytochrome c oxidase assembly protein, putative [Plasmodium ovale wallikeri]|uniref:Heme O synthase n=1 Tax=Plasmodium ovale wallikeri TaxID=864142 RepID=A0A1A8YYS4_PLAOA|nr:cytochrome c oxidase assembly protein, putative [Plasmodium ovale wallikeri]SBT36619.1 cytochrome c oxidase assembly protein, putative [Plasmodium ovale wallikeri]